MHEKLKNNDDVITQNDDVITRILFCVSKGLNSSNTCAKYQVYPFYTF